MKYFDPAHYPLLSVLERNRLTTKIFKFIKDSSNMAYQRLAFSLKFFVFKDIHISVITKPVHEFLSSGDNFLEDKSMLADTAEFAGLLFLPEALMPIYNLTDLSEGQSLEDFAVNAIFFVWMGHRAFDKLAGDFQNEKESAGRTLFILPYFGDTLSNFIRQEEMVSLDDVYNFPLNKMYERAHYGRIHDYVMSFILLNQYSEQKAYLLKGGKRISRSFFIHDYNKIQVLE